MVTKGYKPGIGLRTIEAVQESKVHKDAIWPLGTFNRIHLQPSTLNQNFWSMPEEGTNPGDLLNKKGRKLQKTWYDNNNSSYNVADLIIGSYTGSGNTGSEFMLPFFRFYILEFCIWWSQNQILKIRLTLIIFF